MDIRPFILHPPHPHRAVARQETPRTRRTQGASGSRSAANRAAIRRRRRGLEVVDVDLQVHVLLTESGRSSGAAYSSTGRLLKRSTCPARAVRNGSSSATSKAVAWATWSRSPGLDRDLAARGEQRGQASDHVGFLGYPLEGLVGQHESKAPVLADRATKSRRSASTKATPSALKAPAFPASPPSSRPDRLAGAEAAGHRGGHLAGPAAKVDYPHARPRSHRPEQLEERRAARQLAYWSVLHASDRSLIGYGSLPALLTC